MNVLFICSRNQWRGPTAERVWHNHPALAVRSAGTSASARRGVTEADLDWADVIFAMEKKHRTQLLAAYVEALTGKPMHVVDISDEYQFMDPELVEFLRSSVGHILNLVP